MPDDELIAAEERRRKALSTPSRTSSNVERATQKIEAARVTGKALTGKDMGKDEQAALKGLLAKPSSYAKGGMVKKSGFAKVHKGERVMRGGRCK